MKGLTNFILVWMLITSSVEAATLTPTLNDQAIGISLSDVALPDTLMNELASGFEHRLLLRVVLISQAVKIVHADAMITAKYDLWDERYIVRTMAAGRLENERLLPTIQGVIAQLKTIRLDQLFLVENTLRDRDLMLQAELLINPIERQKIEQLREWVATHSTPNQALGYGVAFTPKPNDMFNRIFEQYTNGADLSAAWSLTIRSQPFRVDQLIKDKSSR
jgi:hypothetical protein